ncbi:WXG100 family type VII secretion target [Saccharothrix sp. HUAS TT1]|uniref:WXG100 family type VII secretion target n=1 Tax=unclassified Saccharothrix TaxID=2593673 RepID=UPI00345BE711
MSGGYRVDPDVLTAFAGRLDEVADEARAAASTVAEPPGDLGPEGVTEAVEHLVAEWARALRGVGLDAVADEVRAAGETYRRADELRHD